MSHKIPTNALFTKPQDESSNASPNPSFDSVLSARMSRRGILRGGMGGATTLMLGSVGALGLTACGGGEDHPKSGDGDGTLL
jgi:hypothetical protein